MIFRTMKNDSLSINTIASKSCLCHRNVFQNGPNSFLKVIVHSYILYQVLYEFVQTSPAYGQNTYQIIYGETLEF